MKVAVVGGGAIGTLLGASFSPDVLVSVIDRGDRLENLKEHGFRLLRTNGEIVQRTPHLATYDYREAGPQDFVFLAVKAYDLPAVAQEIGHLLGPDTTVVTLQNGLPWWYFHKHAEPYEDLRLRSLDPLGDLSGAIDPGRIVGCVAYPAAELLEDGCVRHVEGLRFPVGELDGVVRERTETLVRIFESAGFKSRAIPDIRAELWLKAWGALSINPISALTGGRMDEICSHALTRTLVATMMKEAEGIARCLGISFRHTIEKRIEGARAVGPHKTSMLADLEAGKKLETEALVGVVVELAGVTRQPAPSIEAVYACIALLAEKAGT